MSSLRDLLAGHDGLLWLDAASSCVQVGWLKPGATARWHASEEEAGIALFAGLEALALDPAEAAAFVYCEGPGSMLGIRCAAMAIRTWCTLAPRPVYAYASLALVAHASADPDTVAIADARRQSWHCCTRNGRLERVSADSFHPSSTVVTPRGFRHWSPLPPGTQEQPYDLAALLEHPGVRVADLFRRSDAPDAFVHEEPAYAVWSQQIHRAPHSPA